MSTGLTVGLAWVMLEKKNSTSRGWGGSDNFGLSAQKKNQSFFDISLSTSILVLIYFFLVSKTASVL
jgi:hypothetical protein